MNEVIRNNPVSLTLRNIGLSITAAGYSSLDKSYNEMQDKIDSQKAPTLDYLLYLKLVPPSLLASIGMMISILGLASPSEIAKTMNKSSYKRI